MPDAGYVPVRGLEHPNAGFPRFQTPQDLLRNTYFLLYTVKTWGDRVPNTCLSSKNSDDINMESFFFLYNSDSSVYIAYNIYRSHTDL